MHTAVFETEYLELCYEIVVEYVLQVFALGISEKGGCSWKFEASHTALTAARISLFAVSVTAVRSQATMHLLLLLETWSITQHELLLLLLRRSYCLVCHIHALLGLWRRTRCRCSRNTWSNTPLKNLMLCVLDCLLCHTHLVSSRLRYTADSYHIYV